MANIQKLPQRRFWFAMYRDANGKQHCKSTKIEHTPEGKDASDRKQLEAKNKRLAQDLANDLEEAERGNPTVAHLRKLVADISTRVNARQIDFERTEAFLRGWLGRIQKTKSPATHNRYTVAVDAFLTSLGSKAQAALADITAEDVQQFIARRLAGGRNPTTVKVDLKSLNVPFSLALRQGLILTNPVLQADDSGIRDAKKESRQPFTPEQLQSLVDASDGEWRTAILFGGLAGLRLGDAVSVVWGNLNFEKHTLTIRPQKTRRNKRDLVIPLHPALEKYLLDLPGGDSKSPLCPTLAKFPVGGRRGLSRQFMAILAKAKIEQQSIEAGGKSGHVFNRYGFHSLRHTFVTQLANAGVAPDVRQLLSGHADEKSHAIYSHHNLQTLRDAIAKTPTIKI